MCVDQERLVLKDLRHPNVIALQGSCSWDPFLVLLLPLAHGGNLCDFRLANGHYVEADAKFCFSNINDGLSYVHSCNIIHRDVKLDNILLFRATENVVYKLSDLGWSRVSFSASDCQAYCGTPLYSAPEVIMCAPKWTGRRGRGYGRAADIWSFGIVTYILLCGTPPFPESGLFQHICNGHLDFVEDAWSTVSQSMRTLVRRLLMVRCYDRMSLDNVSKQLQSEEAPAGLLGYVAGTQ